MATRDARSIGGRGFALVELLVVIGLVVILIALLLPALGKARRQAQRIACAANMKQVAWAFLAYAQDNKGWFPAPGNGFSPPHDEDWVHWQPGRDPKEGRLYRYLGNNLVLLNCPAGPPEWVPPAGRPPYRYSYSVNVRFTGDSGSTMQFGVPGAWNIYPCKLWQIVAASQKILVIEEDVTAINDGSWMTGTLELPDGRPSSLSVRHDRGREYGDWLDPQYAYRGRGNVAFADGHCDFIPRSGIGRLADPRERL